MLTIAPLILVEQIVVVIVEPLLTIPVLRVFAKLIMDNHVLIVEKVV